MSPDQGPSNFAGCANADPPQVERRVQIARVPPAVNFIDKNPHAVGAIPKISEQFLEIEIL